MKREVKIIDKKRVLDHFFKVDEARLQHTLFSGQMSEELTRLCLDRGDSVAALVYDTDHKMLLLIEQFRYPAYEKGPGWLVEVPAGMIDEGETPERAMIRELKEECGHAIAIQDLHFIGKFYPSPGGSSERIFLYYATISGQTRFSAGGGCIEEGEDIRKIAVGVDEVMQQLERNEIVDAKTIIALQWYRHRAPHSSL